MSGRVIIRVAASLSYLAVCATIPTMIKLNERPVPLQALQVPNSDGGAAEYIYIKDPSLMNPFVPNSDATVPNIALVFLCIFPLLAIVGALAVRHFGKRGIGSEQDLAMGEGGDSLYIEGGDREADMLVGGIGTRENSRDSKDRELREPCLVNALISYLYALGTALLVTNAAKAYVGRLRPNFYDMCGFNDETRMCEGDAKLIAEGRSSFPSGHASLSACSCVFVSVFLAAHFQHAKPASNFGVLGSSVRLATPELVWAVTIVPILVAAFVAASRVHDNWHFPSDVIAGSCIGSASSICAFYRFYYSYSSYDQRQRSAFS